MKHRISSYAILFIAIATVASIAGCGYSDEQIMADVSGVWRGTSDGSMVEVDLNGSQQAISVNGQQFPVTIASIDRQNHVVTLDVDWAGDQVLWTLRQVFDTEDNFHLVMTLHEGTQDVLAFVRNL